MKSDENKPEEKRFYTANVSSNKQKLQRLQDVMSLALGVAAGVLGLEAQYGFSFFLGGLFLSNLSFYVVCCQGEPNSFFVSPVEEIFFEGIATSISGFVMMWCLTFALVK